MEQGKTDIIRAKIRGYLTTIKALASEINSMQEPLMKEKTAVVNEVKSDNPAYTNVRNNIVELETLARRFGTISMDVEKYLFKIGTLKSVLEYFGETFEKEGETLSEEDQKLLQTANEYSYDKNSFVYGEVDGKIVVLNEEMMSEIEEESKGIRNNEQYLQSYFERAKMMHSTQKPSN